MTLLASMSWPEAAVWIVGVIAVGAVVVAATWQIFGTGRDAVTAEGSSSYKKLAEAAAASQERIAAELARTADELSALRTSTAELERLLKDVG